jgi:hypothetical protein
MIYWLSKEAELLLPPLLVLRIGICVSLTNKNMAAGNPFLFHTTRQRIQRGKTN